MASGFRAVILSDDRVRRFLHILLLLYVFKEILTAILMPPFTGHDEVAHFSYIRTVATEHRLPTAENAIPRTPKLTSERSPKPNELWMIGTGSAIRQTTAATAPTMVTAMPISAKRRAASGALRGAAIRIAWRCSRSTCLPRD